MLNIKTELKWLNLILKHWENNGLTKQKLKTLFQDFGIEPKILHISGQKSLENIFLKNSVNRTVFNWKYLKLLQ